MNNEQAAAALLQHQDVLEREALALLQHPLVIAARRDGERALLASVPQADPYSQQQFAAAAEEIALNAIMNVVNDGSPLPKPRLIMRPPHTLAGNTVAGNRGLDDNPDTYYRIIPVDGDANFILEGQLRPHQPTIFELSLLSKTWRTIGNLSKHQIDSDAQGNFSLHIGYEPRATGSQFMASAADAEMLVIRETLADWEQQQPAFMNVRPVTDAATSPAWQAAYAQRTASAAAERVRRWFEQTIQLHAAPFALPVNTLPQPVITDEIGKLVTQAYAIGYFAIEDDQALIVTLTQGEATYVVVPVTNIWGVSEDPVNTQASLNTLQARPNPDGSFTFVVAATDPGVHNWVDIGALRQGFLFLRWAGLSEQRRPGGAGLAVDTQLSSIDQLREKLPAGTAWVGPGERQTQLQRRAAAYRHRFSA